ncbi:hypothetical protein GWG65_22975 [Bradyrhizobium sp. CSA207]|nr:hypothetical protein [Bradyrhizobium sp. CSA207]
MGGQHDPAATSQRSGERHAQGRQACRKAHRSVHFRAWRTPWIGFPVGYAVSGILLTVFGYFAMILAQ